MSKWRIAWSTLASTSGALAIFFVLCGKSSTEFDRISTIGLISMVVVSFWWKKLTEHRAYGMGLLFCGSVAQFVHSWIIRGLDSKETIFCGVLSTLILFYVVVIVRQVARS
jgi:hypothetical protein